MFVCRLLCRCRTVVLLCLADDIQYTSYIRMAPTALNIHVNASSDSGVVSARTEALSEQSTIEVPYVFHLTFEIELSAGLLPIPLIVYHVHRQLHKY